MIWCLLIRFWYSGIVEIQRINEQHGWSLRICDALINLSKLQQQICWWRTKLGTTLITSVFFNQVFWDCIYNKIFEMFWAVLALIVGNSPPALPRSSKMSLDCLHRFADRRALRHWYPNKLEERCRFEERIHQHHCRNERLLINIPCIMHACRYRYDFEYWWLREWKVDRLRIFHIKKFWPAYFGQETPLWTSLIALSRTAEWAVSNVSSPAMGIFCDRDTCCKNWIHVQNNHMFFPNYTSIFSITFCGWNHFQKQWPNGQQCCC